MGEIVSFSKAFAKVDSNDDFLLTFELGYSDWDILVDVKDH